MEKPHILMDLFIKDSFFSVKKMVQVVLNQFLKNMKVNGNKIVNKVKEGFKFYRQGKLLKVNFIKINLMEKLHWNLTIIAIQVIGSRVKNRALVKKSIIGGEYLNNNLIKISKKNWKINNLKKRKIMIAIRIRVNLLITNSMEKANIVLKFQITFMKDNLLMDSQKVTIFLKKRLSELVPDLYKFKCEGLIRPSKLNLKNFAFWSLCFRILIVRWIKEYLCNFLIYVGLMRLPRTIIFGRKSTNVRIDWTINKKLAKLKQKE